VIADGAERAVGLALQDTAEFILILVRLNAPVLTGALRDSYKIEKRSPLHILIGSMLLYAKYQEFGTSKMGAQPHLVPAFVRAKSFLEDRIAVRINELI